MSTQSILKKVLANEPLQTVIAARLALARIRREAKAMIGRPTGTVHQAFFSKLDQICTEYEESLDEVSEADVARIIKEVQRRLAKTVAKKKTGDKKSAKAKKDQSAVDFEEALDLEIQVHRQLASDTTLNFLTALFVSTQAERIRLTNRINAWVQNNSKNIPFELMIRLKAQIEEMENMIKPKLAQELVSHPAAEFVAGIAGIGPVLAARIISLIPMKSETDFCNYSKLRKLAGMAPGFDRKIKGQKCSFNPRLRTALHVLWQTWVRLDARGILPARHYIAVYKKWVDFYSANRPDWNKMHIMLAAKRKCLDPFLCHLWQAWRTKQGWDCRPLYVHERLNHQDKYEIEEFWDKELAQKRLRDWKNGKL
ncbi:MAG: hypothetical protein KatS3mg087_1101 [Patescibacteria group bacterium]|nr:MAG: hypothetical protein KatS3mg087_1101 [Patescibacteria group bacterium]